MCYIKCINNKPFKLTGKEYSEAENKCGPIVEIKNKRHEELKRCRDELYEQK